MDCCFLEPPGNCGQEDRILQGRIATEKGCIGSGSHVRFPRQYGNAFRPKRGEGKLAGVSEANPRVEDE